LIVSVLFFTVDWLIVVSTSFPINMFAELVVEEIIEQVVEGHAQKGSCREKTQEEPH